MSVSAPPVPLKVLSVIGTRPEAIKMAPVILELQRRAPAISSRVCVTAQHREMMDSVLSLFGIVPDHDLAVMQPGQSPTRVAAKVLLALDDVLMRESPDWVLVQGDTTTAFAASVAAFYRGVRVGHVEAGLRTDDKHHPFPEEINRRMTSAVADLHFAPTARSRDNLLREGVAPADVLLTGNSVIDALRQVAAMPYDLASGPLADIPADRRVVLVTAHRRENFGPRLESICDAICALAEQYAGDVQIVYPVHPNPSVRATVDARLRGRPGITLLEPVDYSTLVQLLKRCTFVLTDSGGIQEEAPGLGKPVLIMRDVTERPEAVESGTAVLVGTDRDTIISRARSLLDDAEAYEKMARAVNPFGDGFTSRRIADALIR